MQSIEMNERQTIDDFINLMISANESVDKVEVSALIAEAISSIDSSLGTKAALDVTTFEVLSEFSYILVEDFEDIITASEQAKNHFGVRIGSIRSQIDLSEFIGTPREDTSNSAPKVVRAWSETLRRKIDVSCIFLGRPEKGKQRQLLVLSDPQANLDVEWIGERFDLSKSELDVAKLFFSGCTIEDIARTRGRSLGTVKTQFYKILEKCGCKNRADFLRLSLNEKRHKDIWSPVSGNLRKSKRHQFLLARPGGRTLDVLAVGDPDGDLVIACNTIVTRQAPESYENYFFDAGIYYCAIAPPGSGKTSPPRKGETTAECFAKDIESLLFSLEHESTVLFGSGVSFPLCLQAASIKPDRIKAIFSNTIIIPEGRRLNASSSSHWLTRFRRKLGNRTKTAETWIFHTVLTYYHHVGLKRFIKNSLTHSPKCFEAIMQPDVLSELEDAFGKSFAQGAKSNAQMFQLSVLGDWEPHLMACPVPIYLSVGELDLIGPHSAIKCLAEDYPEKIQFSTVTGASSSYPYVFPQEFLDLIERALLHKKADGNNCMNPSCSLKP